MEPKVKATQLPIEVMTFSDIGELLFELGQINQYWLQQRLRREGEQTVQPPKASPLIEKVAAVNKLNLLQEADRVELGRFLATLKQSAPRLHISFGSEPTRNFLGQLVSYFRGNFHPLLLLSVGLQPNIGVGCTLRTTNRFFDLSLRSSLSRKSDLLLAQIKAAYGEAG